MTNKRIAIVIDSLTGGGAEKVMLSLASELIKQGHAPHFFVLQEKCVYELPLALIVHYCFESSQKNIDSMWNIKSSTQTLKRKIESVETRSGKFDLFLTNLDKSNLLTTKADLSPLFCVIHNSVEEELKRQVKLGPFAYMQMLKTKKVLNGQHLITVSHGIEREIKEAGRITPASIRTIYNPFDLDVITSHANEPDSDIPNEDFILHIGRVAKQKRHDILFEAFAQVKRPIKLVLLCNNKKKAMRIAEKYRVADRIICPGFKTNPFPWIKRAKLLVLSSDFEGLPTVLIESLVCGTPVVSTDCNHGPKEILTGELAHYLVPRRDAKALAKKIDNILSTPPNIGELEIFNKVSADVVAKSYLQLIS